MPEEIYEGTRLTQLLHSHEECMDVAKYYHSNVVFDYAPHRNASYVMPWFVIHKDIL